MRLPIRGRDLPNDDPPGDGISIIHVWKLLMVVKTKVEYLEKWFWLIASAAVGGLIVSLLTLAVRIG